MLRLDMNGSALANTRFAISPLHTAVDALCLLRADVRSGGGGWGALVRETVRDRKLALLAALFAGSWDYVPDLIKPELQREEGHIQDELHAVATVSAERLRWEIASMIQGNPSGHLSGRPAPRVLLDLLERGESAVAERFAAELHQLWRAVVGPHWATMRGRMEADIAHRARTTARQGLSATLAGLHPRVVWSDDHVRLLTPFEGHIPGTTRLVLTPTVFEVDLRISIDPFPGPLPRQPMLTYPARPTTDTGPAAAPPSHALLGVTRARLLSDLHVPRSTAELGERHFLASSTVSYHLGILHRAGLVSRTRTRRQVLYAQTHRATGLLVGAPEPQ
ncbi:helix-turn-helix domain-containing protein [Streptomyces sp. NBC_00536]|uniref:ArsR/SmtB family transcription factor n=1 Tax=Streptomyces sp. NBC_00536 TaxID=2975769 RepID=UPI002E81F671|nr:winged helix-turn-helix domain-containing protein [Streptomyces sp. NBC_00536]WUC77021.1 helix-turn-helix domain-containing protein [Streptomyces sp. NBC_00536]